jgi:transmembrane sensor
MDTKKAKELLSKQKAGTLTDEERALLESWYLDLPVADKAGLSEEEISEDLRQIRSAIPYLDQENRQIRLWPRIAAAASVVIALSFGGYFLLRKNTKDIQPVAKTERHDVAPGQNQATLTLAGGQKIILTKGLSGKLATQGQTLVQVNAGNAITYSNLSAAGKPAEIAYNTLSTVRGQQSPYPLVLADGTKVWLNAASSITFPTAFTGAERVVKITGEAYFEVKHNAAQPFKVTFNNQTVEDIGTSFDINAYDDEPTDRTTLISGSVKVSGSGKTVLLKPGQAALGSPDGNRLLVKDADVEESIAWKNGYFMFDSESLESVMRKISRWYDVDVAYTPGQQMDERYLGSISRIGNISKVLNMLERTGDVRFKIEGKKIIVQKK